VHAKVLLIEKVSTFVVILCRSLPTLEPFLAPCKRRGGRVYPINKKENNKKERREKIGFSQCELLLLSCCHSTPLLSSCLLPLARLEYLYFAFIVRQENKANARMPRPGSGPSTGPRDPVPIPILNPQSSNPDPNPASTHPRLGGSAHKFNALIDCVRRWATTSAIEEKGGREVKKVESITKGELHSNRGQCKLLAPPRVADNSVWLFA